MFVFGCVQAKHPVLVIQDPKGLHRPICHEFVPRNGLSTFPLLMIGHPSDVPGGPLVSTEAAIHERIQRTRREVAEAADPQVALEEKRRGKRKQLEKREEACMCERSGLVWAQVDELIVKIQRNAVVARQLREARASVTHPSRARRSAGGSGLVLAGDLIGHVRGTRWKYPRGMKPRVADSVASHGVTPYGCKNHVPFELKGCFCNHASACLRLNFCECAR